MGISLLVAHWTNTPLDVIWRWSPERLLRVFDRAQELFKEKGKGHGHA